MKIVLIHGKNTDPSQKWYPWLGEEVKKMGHEFIAPILPSSANPTLDDWLTQIDKTEPDENTILIGHSRGGVAIMRWLERQALSKKVKKVILVSTNSGLLKDKPILNESDYGFYTDNGYDFERIKLHCHNFTILHSTDDTWVPFVCGEKNSIGLSAKFLKFNNRGHFGKNIFEIPALIPEIIK